MKKIFLALCVATSFCASRSSLTANQEEADTHSNQKQEQRFSALRAGPLFKGTHFSSVTRGGYIAATNLTHPKPFSVSKTSAEWTVPSLKTGNLLESNNLFAGAMIYVGMGDLFVGSVHGRGSSLLQQNLGWYGWLTPTSQEIFPLPSLHISPGDRLSAKASLDENFYRITLINQTTNKGVRAKIAVDTIPQATLSMAQWTVADPKGLFNYFSFSNFGSISMRNCSVKINGKDGPINDPLWQSAPIRMVSTSDIVKVHVSHLKKEGTQFRVTFTHD